MATDSTDFFAKMRALISKSGMFPVLILLCLGFHFITGRFLSMNNIFIVMQQASINIVLAAGMTFVILTGGIDLSVGSILAVSAITGLMVSLLPEFGYLAVPAALGIGLLFGLINGMVIAYLKLPPFIATLGSMTAVRGIARLMASDNTVSNLDLSFSWIGSGTFYSIPWMAIIAFLVVLISWFILKRTVMGVWIYAVGGNEEAARLTGIKVTLVILVVYGISGLLAALGGVMSAARLYAANGQQLGQSYELDAIASVILGGTSFIGGVGSIWGTLVGALIIAILSNGLILVGVSDLWQYVIKGLVIIAAVTIDNYRLGKKA